MTETIDLISLIEPRKDDSEPRETETTSTNSDQNEQIIIKDALEAVIASVSKHESVIELTVPRTVAEASHLLETESTSIVEPDQKATQEINRIFDPTLSSEKTQENIPKATRSVEPARPETTPGETSNRNQSNIPPINNKVHDGRKTEDDKLAIYKALAIKLKKELVKSRDETQRIRSESDTEINTLRLKVKLLEDTLEKEKLEISTRDATFEATVRNLRSQLNSTETDLQSLQTEFENYKTRASKIMQQNQTVQSNASKPFEEELYKNLRELNEEQRQSVRKLESQVATLQLKNAEYEKELRQYREKLHLAQVEIESLKEVESESELLRRENENLKTALKQFRTKLKDPSLAGNTSELLEEKSPVEGRIGNKDIDNMTSIESYDGDKTSTMSALVSAAGASEDVYGGHDGTRISPSISVKEDSQATNSGSSCDDSTSGYVHIKPTAFEIISRTSVLEEAQNQIDNLTKAYLDSENTNSLLSEQVRALKEEIRRMQRGSERLDLAENLEYLKNVVLKFISLDSGQSEQRKQLVPVLSTILKLSPDETAKFNSLAQQEKTSVASSFFKF